MNDRITQRVGEREREKERGERREREQDFPSMNSLPKWSQRLVLSQAKARSKELHSGHPTWTAEAQASERSFTVSQAH